MLEIYSFQEKTKCYNSIVGGDFNITRDKEAYKLITKGNIENPKIDNFDF